MNVKNKTEPKNSVFIFLEKYLIITMKLYYICYNLIINGGKMKNLQEIDKFLNSLPRINNVSQASCFKGDVLLLPNEVKIFALSDGNVGLTNFTPGKDYKPKDMLRVITIEDAFNVKYHETNILSPSLYIHSLEDKPWHITTQGLLITYLTEDIKNYILKEDVTSAKYYAKHILDRFWLPCSKPINQTNSNDLVCIFNRRISGWDGSINRPVIELLGAGGHLQSIWNEKQKTFVNRNLQDNLKKEFGEEIGQFLKKEDIIQIGGFINEKTHELVVLYCVNINCKFIPNIQKFATGNLKEDTDGVYLGTFNEVINFYKKDPTFFAGGSNALKTNFPSNKKIMNKIINTFYKSN